MEQEHMVKNFKRKLWEDYQSLDAASDQPKATKTVASLPKEEVKSLGGFPSIPHLPFSPQVHSDDTVLSSTTKSPFVGVEVIITEKLDGGNCCWHNGTVYARTHSHPASHDSFGPIKALFARMQDLLPKDLYLFGENMTGIHSIEYSNLHSPFYLFAVHDPTFKPPKWWSWDDVNTLANQLSLPTVPIFYRGTFKTMSQIESWMTKRMASVEGSTFGGQVEGFVIRPAADFSDNGGQLEWIAKYVRKGHVQTDEGWKRTWRKAKIHHLASETEVETEAIDGEAGTDAAVNATPIASVSEIPPESQSPASSATAKPTMTAKETKVAKEALKRRKQQAKRAPRFVILVGLPGSGKSTFAKQLEGKSTRNAISASFHTKPATVPQPESPGDWIPISQDTLGSHSACVSLLSSNLRKANTSKCRILIDRCNVEKKDRKEWLDLMMRPDCTCVFFDVDKDACKERVAGRSDHPTIPMGKGVKIVEGFAKRLEVPEVGEGFRNVVVVRSFEEGEALARSWGA
ncbi:hypothetical protein HK097_007296 [Rhizophlyctis rosea]|uniref:RNA ligase domain-containing protein n=1 Tax=Rhizophlyctis rosea TaxID=64517 RepID=A0AAD5SBT1_9FUNG|nr:hypothetical protein HK097_007296 [Rhizophlyctis rosea]